MAPFEMYFLLYSASLLNKTEFIWIEPLDGKAAHKREDHAVRDAKPASVPVQRLPECLQLRKTDFHYLKATSLFHRAILRILLLLIFHMDPY